MFSNKQNNSCAFDIFKNVIFVLAYQRITTKRKDCRQPDTAIQATLGSVNTKISLIFLYRCRNQRVSCNAKVSWLHDFRCRVFDRVL